MGEAKRRKVYKQFEELLKPIYTFIDNDGVNTHIDAAKLRIWCLRTKPETSIIPIDRELAMSFIRTNVISARRVQAMLANHKLLEEPVIFCLDGTFSQRNGGPNGMLVDGHHRYFVKAYLKMMFIEGYILTSEQWLPFKMHDLPSITQDELQRIPVIPRRYHK